MALYEGEAASNTKEQAAGSRKPKTEAAERWDWHDAQAVGSAKSTLLALRTFCGDRNYCWPSYKALRTRAGAGVSKLQRHLEILTHAGSITVISRERFLAIYILKYDEQWPGMYDHLVSWLDKCESKADAIKVLRNFETIEAVVEYITDRELYL